MRHITIRWRQEQNKRVRNLLFLTYGMVVAMVKGEDEDEG
jgi:hypothetical protein